MSKVVRNGCLFEFLNEGLIQNTSFSKARNLIIMYLQDKLMTTGILMRSLKNA